MREEKIFNKLNLNFHLISVRYPCNNKKFKIKHLFLKMYREYSKKS